MRAVGIQVVESFGSHEKVVLIDGIDGYYGSLNLLSHAGKSSELMVHLYGEEQAAMFRATISRSGRA